MTDSTDMRTDRAGGDRCFITEADLRELTAELLAAGTEVIAPVASDICASPSAIASAACRMPGAAPIRSPTARSATPQSWTSARLAGALAQGVLPPSTRRSSAGASTA